MADCQVCRYCRYCLVTWAFIIGGAYLFVRHRR
jgi:hypothetical protein